MNDSDLTASRLAPYVPHLVVDWLHESPAITTREVDGTVVFADISGFTKLTEQLARRGKVGAEEISDVLNLIFEQLLTAAYDYGAGLLKWGGDAVLLFFEGEQHPALAACAAAEMQRTLHRVGRLRTSAGTARLRMSIGMHSGTIHLFLVGGRHRELLVTGPGATAVARMEKLAQADQVVVSAATAAQLPPGSAQEGAQGSYLLTNAPRVGLRPNRVAKALHGVDLGTLMCDALRKHLTAGVVDSEHRQVAVGFIEFSGVDALLDGSGPPAVADALEHLVTRTQDQATTHGITFLASDVNPDGGKLLLIAGVPGSAGDDEARMLSAVRAVLDDPGALPVRAGVHAGRVFAGDFGPHYRRTYSVAGDCVNLAARLMAHARPGQLLATTEALARSRTSFRLSLLPPLDVKGKAAPVEAASVGEPLAVRASVLTESVPLVGRERELDTLLEAYAHARRGHGRVVELVGEPGLGKTRLIEELVVRSGARLLHAHGDIYATSAPYLPLQRLLREQLGVEPDAGAEVLEAAVLRAVAGLAPRLLPWLPLIGVVAGLELTSTPEVDAIDASFRHVQLQHATSQVLGLVIDTPAVFVFEDVGFMDDATLGLLRRLVADVHERPWLMVVTRRPEWASPLTEDVALERISLGPLSGPAAAQLLQTVTDNMPLPPHQHQALAARAGGNPLFLRELVAGLGRSGDLEELPESVEGVIAARIDRLDPAARALLRSMSVLGMEVDPTLLACTLDDGRLPDVDEQALAGFVTRDEHGTFRFAHHLARQVAYEGLPYRRRMVLHGRAGDAIEMMAGNGEDRSALLSLHYAAAERHGAAWHWSRVAGDRARARWATADAADCYQRALDATAHLPDLGAIERAAVLEALGDARVVLGEVLRAQAAFDGARRQATGDSVRLARLRLKTARVYERTGQYSRALGWLTRGLRGLEAAGDCGEAATAVSAALTSRYARLRQQQGHQAEATRWAHRAIALAERCGEQVVLAETLGYLDLVDIALGRLDGRPHSLRSLEIYRQLGDRLGEANALNNLGVRAYFEGRWPDAVRAYGDAAAAFELAGNRWDAATCSANAAEIFAFQGRLGEAADILHEAMQVWRGSSALSEVAFGTYQLGRIAARSGQFAIAREMYGQARRYFATNGEQVEVLEVDALLAECHLLEGRWAAALCAAQEALSRADAMGGVLACMPLLHRVRGQALARLRRPRQARGALDASLAAARSRRARHEIALTLDALLPLAPVADRDELARERDKLCVELGLDIDRHAPAIARHVVGPSPARSATSAGQRLESGSGR